MTKHTKSFHSDWYKEMRSHKVTVLKAFLPLCLLSLAAVLVLHLLTDLVISHQTA